MKRYIDIDVFLEFISKTGKPIETITISTFFEISLRSIQKWCLNNGIKYTRKRGIKNYIWDTKTIQKYGEWFNEKHREGKNYYKPRIKKTVISKKPIKYKKKPSKSH
jgi:hypothetical protein